VERDDAEGEEHIDVTVVLPAYNERDHVVAEIDRIRTALDASPYAYEIIAVDDCSTDGTGEVLETVPDIRLIRLPRNGGSGTARRIGSTAARGDVVVWTDADMTYPNDQIPQLVKELEGHDQVVGARTSEQGTHKLLRVPAKWAIRKLASYLTRSEIPDLNSGLRAFRRDVGAQYLNQLPAGFSCVTTMTMTFLANGYSVKYVPIPYARRAGRSKFHPVTDTRRYGMQVIRMMMSYEPLRIFLPIGLALLTLGVVKLAYDVFDKDVRVAGNTLLILMASFLAVAVGLLADLVVRMTKPRDPVASASVVDVWTTDPDDRSAR
jgi:polyisoprenyl-phosphate glycosyltransferase